MNLQAVTSDKRQFSRIDFDAPVTLISGGNQWKSELLDISLKGALVSIPDNWQANTNGEYKLSIFLDNSDVEIDMDVSLAREEKDQLGFRCEHIDLDSITALRRLIELNLGNEELLEREISNMMIG